MGAGLTPVAWLDCVAGDRSEGSGSPGGFRAWHADKMNVDADPQSSAPSERSIGGASSRPSALLQRVRDLVCARVAPDAIIDGVQVIAQAEGVDAILADLGVDDTARAAAWLIHPAEWWPVGLIAKEFDPVLAHLVERMRQLIRLSLGTGAILATGAQREMLRRMLLAMADDIRVVLLCLASRLQTLRARARAREAVERRMAQETLDVLAPLANRLGLWQIKWELEDLAFRFLEPDTYRSLAARLEEKRAEREAFVMASVDRLRLALAAQGLVASVTGRPKHLYSIHVKMQAKRRDLEGIQDLRGLRVIVDTIEQCYQTLDVAHGLWKPIASEYDDYIARPKPNGYRSLHTVVVAEDGMPLEVQIRTVEMHRFAEYGVASHWRYKESSRSGERGAVDAESRSIDWVRQLLAWQREVGQALGSGAETDDRFVDGTPVDPGQAQTAVREGRGGSTPGAHSPGHASAAGLGAGGVGASSTSSSYVYPLTPQGRVIELPLGSTAIDFAYHVHTGLGHRCRGARVDGQIVPLNRPLQTAQTVEIIAAKEGAADGPSRDWLNPSLGFVVSARARGKVRQWFNALEQARDAASGRDRIERVLQREGRTALSFEEVARRLGHVDVASMFVAVARDEIGPRQIEEAVRGTDSQDDSTAPPDLFARRPKVVTGPESAGRGSVLVVGMDSLMNQLARCCRPLPPDPIAGFITRGRGVSVHRDDCSSFRRLAAQSPERVIETGWDPRTASSTTATDQRRFPVEIELSAQDRQGLLRDVSDVFARDRINVTAVNTLSRQQQALMRFTIEASGGAQLETTLVALRRVAGVIDARRRRGSG